MSLADQPVLLGGVAILVAVAAIYIVYNAAAGLPFAPKYEVDAAIPDAESLGKVGDVRLAGVLVGQVHGRHIETLPDGSTRAVLELALDPDLEPLPRGTSLRMRANSALGGSYVELLPGSSSAPLHGNPPTIDATDAPHTISLTDALEAYDARTRRAAARELTGYGDALAGRGADLNAFVAIAPELMLNLDGAARVLASPAANLGFFIDAFARFSEELAPAAEAQAGFVVALDRTFGALVPVRDDVAASATEAPPMLDAGIAGFASQRRMIRETAGLFATLAPGVRAARVAADDIAGAAVGTPPAFRSVRALAPRLETTGDRAHALRASARARPEPAHARRDLRRACSRRGRPPRRPGRVQLPERPAAQPALDAGGRHEHRQLAVGGHRAQPARRERRGGPVVGARGRPRARQLPPRDHHPVCRPGPGARVRVREREVPHRAARDRRRPRPAARAHGRDARHRGRAMRRRTVDRRSDLFVGLAVIGVAVFITYLAFFRPNPVAHRFTVKAVFTSTTGVRPGLTPVRIAGVDVGRVTHVESYRERDTSLVTMELDDRGLPVHADTQMRLRPRLFLEGNSFIQMSPGSPVEPAIREGATIPLRQTSVAVTFPHVLGALTSDTRRSLQQLLQAYGGALRDTPSAEEDATQVAAVAGRPAGVVLNEALFYAARAMPASAQVSDAFTGRERGQLRTAIRDFGTSADALDAPQLPSMLANLRRASAAFADESTAATDGLTVLPAALASSRRAFDRLTVALPPARALARASTASLPSLPAMFTAGVPWLAQARPLLGPDELGADLPPILSATRRLASGARPTGDFLARVGALSRCSTRVLIPTANARIEDGPRTAGTTVWSEFLSALVGIAGQAQNFDGNGFMIRGNPGGGSTPVATRNSRRLDQPMYGNAIAPPLGTRPKAPAGSSLPIVSSTPCAASKPPAVNGDAAAPGPKDGS